MNDIKISKKNEVFLTIEAEPYICQELSDRFTFEVPGAKFMPQYRSKYWDGKIRLFNLAKKELYVGLLDKLVAFAEKSNYTFQFEDNKYYGFPFEINKEISYEGVTDYVTSISTHKPRDYQLDGIHDALKYNRKLLISPTASGKSLMIYSITRYYTERGLSTLIIVPTTSLVEQMYKDFEDYGWNVESYCHKIYSGKERYDISQPVVITTWQSIYKEPTKWFDRFDVTIGDEAHLFKSKSLVDIMTKLLDCKYRFGFTGTLDGTQTHKWVLEGLFGPSYKVTQTKKLIEEGHLSNLDIKILLLKHEGKKFDSYEEEVQYIISNERRNTFIKNLTLDLNGNTLVLYSRVESHGKVLYDLINTSKNKERKVFFVHGGVDAEERELVREITERETNAIIVASYGTFSTGINIRNLHNVIFASPSKSRIRNLQSIGRVLRKGKNKVKAVLYDIADDISLNSSKNYTLGHLMERIKIYNEECFNYNIINVNLKK
jgi:superfamily II DNA or RNA helicase